MASPVDYRETLIVYLRSDSVADAAKTLNTTKQALSSRINAMRKAGVKVPRKTRLSGFGDLEVAKLNSIVNKYLKEVN